MLADAFGRQIDYLRLSVTDRCDLRCTYCMPAEFEGYETPEHWLTFAEILRVSRIFVEMGVSRIRLTGGEPLVRARLSDLVGGLKSIPGIKDLSLSTNGTQLRQHAQSLRTAGLDRLNVSLDTLCPARFAALTRRDVLQQVLEGLETARQSGFTPIKINMVWLPESTEDELENMIRFCMEQGFILRLIENMPMGEGARQAGSLSLQPLIGRLRKEWGLVDHVMPGGGPARYLINREGSFSLGFITPLSQHFCETCNRVRLSVTGVLYLCLGQNDQLELLPMLRSGASDYEIADSIQTALLRKPLKHDFQESPQKIIRVMSATGG